MKLVPVGQVSVSPVIVGPSLLIKASVLPERDACSAVTCGCPEDDEAGKFDDESELANADCLLSVGDELGAGGGVDGGTGMIDSVCP